MKHVWMARTVAVCATSLMVVPVLAASGGATSAPTIANAPRHGGGRIHNTWAASNWSGYAETGNFTGASGTWTVPTVAPSTSATYSATWVGVDGFTDTSLIQTGTEDDYYSGAAHYGAWWEILPAAETPLSTSKQPVAPGDTMSAKIWETSAGSGHGRRSAHLWNIVIADVTKGWSFTTTQSYNGPGTSAEWIMEAPQVNGSIATLADFTENPVAGTGDFDNAGVLDSIPRTGTPTYAGAGLNYANDSGVMIQNGAQVSTPGAPDSAQTAFNVAYGPNVPAAPAG